MRTKPGSSMPLWSGLDYGPALVVLDTADTAPAELPASWRELAQRYQIAWCPIGHGEHALDPIEDVLETLADRRTRTHVIAHALAGDAATSVIAEYPDLVRTLVIVGSGLRVESAGVRTIRVGGTDLRSLDVVRAVESAVDAVRPNPGGLGTVRAGTA